MVHSMLRFPPIAGLLFVVILQMPPNTAEAVYDGFVITDVKTNFNDNTRPGPNWYAVVANRETRMASSNYSELMNPSDLDAGINGHYVYMWVKYEKLPVDSERKVITDITPWHWGNWHVSCPQGYDPKGRLTEGTKTACARTGLCVKRETMKSVSLDPLKSPLSSIYLSVGKRDWPSCPAEIPDKLSDTLDVYKSRPNGLPYYDIHSGCGDRDYYFFCAYSQRPSVSFGVYGDIPYAVEQADTLEKEILPKLADAIDEPIAPFTKQLSFVLHTGDMGKANSKKASISSCFPNSRSRTLAQLEIFMNRGVPAFYTIGDNDWVDCYRVGLEPDDVFDDFMEEFYNPLLSRSGNTVPNYPYYYVERNSWLPTARTNENLHWFFKGVQFSTVHMVGSDNGLDSRAGLSKHEVDARVQRDIEHIDQAFELAKAREAAAVILFTHVDLFEHEEDEHPTRKICPNAAYTTICNLLESHARTFKKPVLLVHGDTNAYCLDQPLPAADNFWRLNGPGDWNVIDADIVTFYPQNKVEPFKVLTMLKTTAWLEENKFPRPQDSPPALCEYRKL